MKLRTFSFLFQVRVDSGIQPGSDISIYYDPMISKVSSISLFSLKQYTHLIKESEVEPFLNNVLWLNKPESTVWQWKQFSHGL